MNTPIKRAMLHQQTLCPWDSSLDLWGPAADVKGGCIDGWRWATDGHTAAVERHEGPSTDCTLGRRVVDLLSSDRGPEWTIDINDLMHVGGVGRVPQWREVYNLDRVRQAVEWLDDMVLSAALIDVPTIHLSGVRVEAQSIAFWERSGARRVLVAPMLSPDHEDATYGTSWVPTIDLPMTDRTVKEAAP